MNIFTKHPHSIGESYLQHLVVAFTYGSKMFCGGLACMIHGIFPFLFQKTGSTTVIQLSERFLSRDRLESDS